MLTKISISKRKEIKSDKQPTHDIIASDDKYENKTVVGSLWTRTTQDGNRFLSGQLDVKRSHEGKSYPGYVIISSDEYERLTKANVTPKGYEGELSKEELDDVIF